VPPLSRSSSLEIVDCMHGIYKTVDCMHGIYEIVDCMHGIHNFCMNNSKDLQL
jgi:hypothetical protein